MVTANSRIIHEGQLAILSGTNEIPQPYAIIVAGSGIQIWLTNQWKLPIKVSCGATVEFPSKFQQLYALGFTTLLPGATKDMKVQVALDCKLVKLIVVTSKRSVVA